MARRQTKAATPATDELAELLVEKISDQVKTLIGRNYPDIRSLLEADEEVKLSFGVSITDRKAEPGTHADKDNKIITTISFSKRHTDKIENSLPDPMQPELSGVNGDHSEEPE